eukprot:16701-Heterococcus_DN1.PRE.1
MASHWCIAEQQYESILKTAFRTLRQQRSAITVHYHQVRYAFKHFLAQADTKQMYLDAYIDVHNALPEAMRFDTNARAELMLRADECRDKLWKDTESRQTNANTVIKAAMEEGWIEHQVALIDNNFMMLIQAEVDKFHAAIGLLIDYYAAQNQDSNTEILLSALLPPPEGQQQEAVGAKGSKKGAAKDKDKDSAHALTNITPPLLRSAQPPDVIGEYVKDAAFKRQGEDDSTTTSSSKAAGAKAVAKAGKGKTAAAATTDTTVKPLARAYTAAVKYASEWQEESLPIPPSTAIAVVVIDSQQQSQTEQQPPVEHYRAQFHRAIWAEARKLVDQVACIQRVGDSLRETAIEGAAASFKQLQQWLNTRVSAEAGAIETAYTLLHCAIENKVPIEYAVVLDGITVCVDTSVRLVEPAAVRSQLSLDIAKAQCYTATPLQLLHTAISDITTDDGWLLIDDVIQVYTGLAAHHSTLPLVQQLEKAIQDTLSSDDYELGSITSEQLLSIIATLQPTTAIAATD